MNYLIKNLIFTAIGMGVIVLLVEGLKRLLK